MQQTSKYQFNLVEGSDDFSPTPLNQNMEKVEEKLFSLDTAVETAQTTANAAYSSNHKPYATGHYTGTGADVSVVLGFKPSYVIVCGHRATDALNTEEKLLYAFSATGGQVVTSRIQLTDTGFVARVRGSDGLYPDLSLSGRTYDYIAFR